MAVMHGYEGDKDAYLKRLRRIEGQIRGLQRMIDEDEYCIDVLTQISAATKALQSVALGLMDDHLHCVAAAVAAAARTPTRSWPRPARPSVGWSVPDRRSADLGRSTLRVPPCSRPRSSHDHHPTPHPTADRTRSRRRPRPVRGERSRRQELPADPARAVARLLDRQQRVWWVESDNRREHLPRLGSVGTPAYGTYHVYSKSRYTTSLDGSARMEYMVRFAWGRSAAIGFHSIPVNRYGTPLQSEAQLGTPLSAGCVRQRWWDAAGLWDWAPIGTTVVVVK
jgi:DNA-binding FrmR family transcriptional regulator